MDFSEIKIVPISTSEAKDIILNLHYARRMPSISYSYGAYINGQLLGIVSYGTPASSTLLEGVCGPEYRDRVKELNRLCLVKNEKNLASFLVAGSFKLIPKPLIIVSYADRDFGHNGYVYQALNFIYTGLSSKFVDPMVMGLEHQHHATYANGLSIKDLKEKYGDRLYFKERNRKHRYIIFLGDKKQKKEMLKKLKYKQMPYPKGDNKKYDTSYSPITQDILF